MISVAQPLLTLDAYLASPQSHERYELIAGQVVPKVSPKRFHSKTQRALLRLLEAWGETSGEIGVEWAVILQRQGQDWVPIPDLLYVASDRLPPELGDEPCPVPPDLAIEIISPDQTFGAMTEKATDYLAAGVQRVWVVDPQARSITVFQPDRVPTTYRSDRVIQDSQLPGLSITAQQVFQAAGLPESR